MKNLVYDFDEGSRGMKDLLGGKGANLSEMKRIGLPVPPGFVITTEACLEYFEKDNQIFAELEEQIIDHLQDLEEKTGKTLGDPKDPLLVSIRSGAVVSMPGMMDTVLNIGLNDETVEGLGKKTDNMRFALDSYRRLLQMFGDVVLSISSHKFDRALEDLKNNYDIEKDTEMSEDMLKDLIEDYKDIIAKNSSQGFPQDPREQIMEGIRAVFDSWNNERAISYRKINNLPDDLGTAVNIQTMVFGNTGENSATGVAFTRNPSTGEDKVYGEFLVNAQGEDVVAGIRTPHDIKELDDIMPDVYEEFMEIVDKIEHHYKDMQDIEFTIEEGEIYLLQTRTGKRTAKASVKIATDLVSEGIIDEEEALLRVEPEQLEQLLHPSFDEKDIDEEKIITTALAASPGAATGKIYFDPQEAKKAKEKGEKVIMVRGETSPEDIEGMNAADGILTSRGGMTSHAAVVARGMGKCCVAGAGELVVEEESRRFWKDDEIYEQGEIISLNGNTGKVYEGEIRTSAAQLSEEFNQILEWADEVRKLGIMANADTPEDSQTALEFGAEGIGLCRTEHMFFDEERISVVREMILAGNRVERKKALEKLLPYQKEDFTNIFKKMKDRKVVIRLLDPPLHEFLPEKDEEIEKVAENLETTPEKVRDTIAELDEVNPMLGHRGCRLGISYPEIYEMQVKAIISAAAEVSSENSYEVRPQIMIPLVGISEEFSKLKELTEETAEEVLDNQNSEVNFEVGTMIEVPRAAFRADKIASNAEDFFSFGTNDLTQMTYGFSRDDAGKFLREYQEKEIIKRDPFTTIDKEGVGEIVKIAIEKGRQADSSLEIGICGEHGGNPPSIKFCHEEEMNYVSCSPFRLPIARIAAARAEVKENKNI
ncbi:pyruvate phosphate dikinase [Halarsenatibacter silvermanii]|uniref:Pyruvate, phosphate dikinase n=1 Tax=Halarsenatibacter silvermanii TaxID=321763 RepID=A0A1G9S7J1_9FIRM|nr:pyruvate, phosphate dikinase [Halarsenatibacter silvermanii]SDM31392.1 pyruvate phosphate dikinase [Halarsenatibacter silvermanii]